MGIVIVTCFALGCTEVEERLMVGVSLERYASGNLRLYPVRANEAFLNNRRNMDTYLTLAEAIKSGKVIVTEHTNRDSAIAQGDDVAEVNTLFIENTSSDTVLILNGEVVTGGKQDRMIARDVVLLPHSGKFDVSVFCVEHGRWTGESDSFQIAEYSLAPQRIRPAIEALPTQQEVWDDVEVHLDMTVTDSETGTLEDIKLNQAHVDKLEKYTQALNNVFDGNRDIIGVIAVAGDKIIGCDLFATPALFNKHFPNLLHAYAAEAATVEYSGTVQPAVVDAYLAGLLADSGRKGNFLKKKGIPITGSAKHVSGD